ncbi:MAG: hypothetical protein CMF23_14850 [Ignavibacteriae bacterium]|nr:hypothetical protein [Ignavibacteriota bacterium]
MQEAVQNNLQFPQVYQSEELASIPGFLNTEKGKAKLSQLEKAKNTTTWVSRIGLGILALLVLITWIDQGFFSALIFGVILFLIYGAVYWVFEKIEKGVEKSYYNTRWDHAVQLGEKLYPVLGSYYYVTIYGEVFLYNDNACAIVDVDNGSVQTFSVNDLKDVQIKEVNLGSETTTETKHKGNVYSGMFSDKYRGTSSTKSSTVNFFAWRLEAYTRVPAYPSFTIDFGEDSEAAKQAYGLLKQ